MQFGLHANGYKKSTGKRQTENNCIQRGRHQLITLPLSEVVLCAIRSIRTRFLSAEQTRFNYHSRWDQYQLLRHDNCMSTFTTRIYFSKQSHELVIIKFTITVCDRLVFRKSLYIG